MDYGDDYDDGLCQWYLNVSLAVVLKELVVKILPNIELAWRVGKPDQWWFLSLFS